MDKKKAFWIGGLTAGILGLMVGTGPLAYGEDIEREYYKNGQVKAEWSYKKGVVDGPYKSYYENGRLKSEVIFRNGKIDSEVKEYDEEGKRIS